MKATFLLSVLFVLLVAGPIKVQGQVYVTTIFNLVNVTDSTLNQTSIEKPLFQALADAGFDKAEIQDYRITVNAGTVTKNLKTDTPTPTGTPTLTHIPVLVAPAVSSSAPSSSAPSSSTGPSSAPSSSAPATSATPATEPVAAPTTPPAEPVAVPTEVAASNPAPTPAPYAPSASSAASAGTNYGSDSAAASTAGSAAGSSAAASQTTEEQATVAGVTKQVLKFTVNGLKFSVTADSMNVQLVLKVASTTVVTKFKQAAMRVNKIGNYEAEAATLTYSSVGPPPLGGANSLARPMWAFTFVVVLVGLLASLL